MIYIVLNIFKQENDYAKAELKEFSIVIQLKF